MTKEKIEILSHKVMEQKQGDKREAVAALVAAVDSFLALGKYKQSEQAARVLAFVRANY